MPTTNFKDAALKTSAELFARLSSSNEGLPEDVALARLAESGKNALANSEVSWQEVFGRQFKSSFIYLLLAACAIAIYLGEYIDATMVFLFLLINASLGFFQEYRAESALQTLKQIIDRKARVRRGGKEKLISAADVVAGDIVLLSAGDMIPADGYFIHAEAVTVDESPMTGETIPVSKSSGALLVAPKDFYGATNIGFSRTTLLSGEAELLVFATGKASEVGAIAEAMHDAESPSAFEVGVDHFSKFILKLVLVTVPFVFVLHTFIQGEHVRLGDFLLFAIALTVSAIPEALPLVTTISLSRGALLLAKKHVVPRRLSAIEDLGSIDILCSDKTGTITENKLSVYAYFGEKEKVLSYALIPTLSGVSANNAQNSVFDHALLAEAPKALRTSLAEWKQIDELPFDPIRRRGSVLVSNGKQWLLVMRGAPELVYAACGKKIPKDGLQFDKEQGANGCRTIAIAYKDFGSDGPLSITEKDEKGLIPLGIVAFYDPLKASTKDAIRHAEQLGVRIKIITGDSREVAGWVGFQAGILTSQDEVITGEELDALSLPEKAEAVERYNVFARMMPLQKYAVIELLQKKHLVGFLGEGFNDAPALKMAHVGLAVEGASDIAQDASDIILLNPSLEVIVDGIKEGRTIFANSMKYIRATLTSNFGNFYALAFASLFVPYLPMLPIQVLLLNLLSDFPMISIATDNVDDAELEKPRGYQLGEITAVALVLGALSTMFDFAFFGYFMHYEEKVLQTMWFVGSILTELILLFSIRTSLPFWKAKRPSALVTWLTVFVALVTITIPYIPVMQRIFGFITPELSQMVIAVVLVLFYFTATEILKLAFYHFWRIKNARISDAVNK